MNRPEHELEDFAPIAPEGVLQGDPTPMSVAIGLTGDTFTKQKEVSEIRA